MSCDKLVPKQSDSRRSTDPCPLAGFYEHAIAGLSRCRSTGEIARFPAGSKAPNRGLFVGLRLSTKSLRKGMRASAPAGRRRVSKNGAAALAGAEPAVCEAPSASRAKPAGEVEVRGEDSFERRIRAGPHGRRGGLRAARVRGPHPEGASRATLRPSRPRRHARRVRPGEDVRPPRRPGARLRPAAGRAPRLPHRLRTAWV